MAVTFYSENLSEDCRTMSLKVIIEKSKPKIQLQIKAQLSLISIQLKTKALT